MREPFSWVKRILGDSRSDVLTLMTPEMVRERSPIVRFVVASGTLAALAVLTIVGVAAFAALLFALAAVYYIATQVLGLKVNVDPQALYQQVYQQAHAYGAN